MRIGLVIYGSLETLTGGYLYDKIMVDYLRSKGCEIQVFSLPWRSYPVHLLDNFSSLYQKIIAADLDILLEDGLNHPSLFLLNKRLKKRTRIVAIIHQILSVQPRSTVKNTLYTAIEKSYFASLDGSIFNSTFTQKAARDKLHFKKSSIVVYPGRNRLKNRISTEQVKQRCNQNVPLKLLILANITRNKGLLESLNALKNVPKKLWQLYVVGSSEFDPKYSRKIKRHILKISLEKNVIFTGPLQNEALHEQLFSSHIMALPFTMEGFGMAYMEGMGYGLPAIGSTMGAAPEIITHDQNGFIVNPKEPELLGEIISCLYKDRDKLTEQSLNALSRFNNHPTWEESMHSLYQYLLKINGEHAEKN